MKIISAVLAQSIEFSISLDKNEALQEHNADLRKQSLTDELTQIYNRRGFMEYGQRLLDFSTETGNGGLVFFGDLDGLKTINDKYGHEYGDIAIKTQAKIFQEVFRQSDICGRLSGDEFGAVLQGMKTSRLSGIRKEIDEAAKRYTEELNLPFALSISFGVVPYDINNYDLTTLLKAADKKLYEEKLKKHGEEYYRKLGIK